jgi:hypothetical protein
MASGGHAAKPARLRQGGGERAYGIDTLLKIERPTDANRRFKVRRR